MGYASYQILFTRTLHIELTASEHSKTELFSPMSLLILGFAWIQSEGAAWSEQAYWHSSRDCIYFNWMRNWWYILKYDTEQKQRE